jgi:beta-glucosidase
VSCNDKVYLDGKVHDLDRIDFLHRYISELEKAYDSGVKILGYFHWSFTDNFEWHSGYSDRFGLVYVDFGSQERIPKDSAYWYQQLIEKNAIPD